MRSQWALFLAGLGALGLLVVLGLTVPTPLALIEPGPTFDVLATSPDGRAVVSVRGRPPVTMTKGALRMTTIAVSKELTSATALNRWLRGDRVVPLDTVIEPNLSPENATLRDLEAFQQSERKAVAAATEQLHLSSPPEVIFDLEGVGGPSAGLILAIAVVELESPEDLIGDLRIAGTGTIDEEGRVGPVGGIREKLIAASEVGTRLFLVPASECAQARTSSPQGISLARVESLAGALESVRANREGRSYPEC